MTGIGPVNGNMDDGSNMMAIMPFRSYRLHHLGITDTNGFTFYIRSDALSCNLLHIGKTASVCSLVGECVTKGGTDRMGGEMLYMGCQMQ